MKCLRLLLALTACVAANGQVSADGYLGKLGPIVRSIQAEAGFPMAYENRGQSSLAERRRAGREAIQRSLAYAPRNVPLDVVIESRQKRQGYELRVISFAGSAHYRIPAFLLVPDKGKPPYPAIVALHDHGGAFFYGKEKIVEMQNEHPWLTAWKRDYYGGRSYASELARRGFVVIVIDAFYWGERRIQYTTPPADFLHAVAGLDPKTPAYIDAVNSYLDARSSDLITLLSFCGLNWLGIVSHDDIRSVDVLSSLPEVDPKRIGCVGLSGGGYRATYLTGMDDRIRASVIVAWMSSLPPILDLPYNTHNDMYDSFLVHTKLDHPDVATLAAPDAAIFVQDCGRDRLFTRAGMDLAAKKISAVYKDNGKPERFQSKYYDVPHSFSVPMQDDAFKWLERWLK